MILRPSRNLGVLLLFLFAGWTHSFSNAAPASERNGMLVVVVTWGDDNLTPANDVYIEAHGYVVSLAQEKSYVLKMVHDGRYEVSLPPAVYDVFISEGTSKPRCKRVLIRPGKTNTWDLNLVTDLVYTLK